MWMGKNSFLRKEKKVAIQFIAFQFVILLTLTFFAALFWNKTMAISTALGGMLAIIPNIIFGIYVFSRQNFNFYLAEAIKISVLVLCLWLILHFYNAALLPLLIGFLGTYTIYNTIFTFLKV